MLHAITYAWKYLKFLIKAQGIKNIHSPFVFELLNNTIFNKTPFYVFKPIEQYRKLLALNSDKITIEDHGAGSKYGNSNEKTISSISRTAIKKPKYAQLLFRLALACKPKKILELGTSLGISTLYLSYASKDVQVVTIEGSKEIAKQAAENFKKFSRPNIDLVVGKFSDKLPEVLARYRAFDFVFIDGHHAEEPTLAYFKTLLKHKTENSVFVFDDIYWSKGMENAWNQVKENEEVSLTIDLFEMGLVYFMKRKQKEHFQIRF